MDFFQTSLWNWQVGRVVEKPMRHTALIQYLCTTQTHILQDLLSSSLLQRMIRRRADQDQHKVRAPYTKKDSRKTMAYSQYKVLQAKLSQGQEPGAPSHLVLGS